MGLLSELMRRIIMSGKTLKWRPFYMTKVKFCHKLLDNSFAEFSSWSIHRCSSASVSVWWKGKGFNNTTAEDEEVSKYAGCTETSPGWKTTACITRTCWYKVAIWVRGRRNAALHISALWKVKGAIEVWLSRQFRLGTRHHLGRTAHSWYSKRRKAWAAVSEILPGNIWAKWVEKLLLNGPDKHKSEGKLHRKKALKHVPVVMCTSRNNNTFGFAL